MILDEFFILSIIFVLLLILIFVLAVALVISVMTDSEDSDNSREGSKQRKNKGVIDSNKSNSFNQETIQLKFGEELQPDGNHQNRNIQQTESYQQEDRQSLTKIVINRKSEYEPECLDEPLDFDGKMSNPQNDERYYLILEKNTAQKLKDSLDWGMKTKRNRVEQGGILLGRVACYENEIYCFVENILLADTTGDPVFVEFTNEMWAVMQEELAKMNAAFDSSEKLAIVGWFHTHPNGLAVFMSGTDMQTQRLNFSQKWQASLVMNPHMRKYRVFFGARAVEGKVVSAAKLKSNRHK